MDVLDLLARLSRTWSNLPRLVRELIIAAIGLVLGFVVVPLAIWAAGNRILGPYVHGTNAHAGPMALLGDLFTGLGEGRGTFWIVALGPLLLITLARGAWYLIVPRAGAGNPPAAPAGPKNPPPGNKSSAGTRRRIEPTVSKNGL